jgi:hypothetical protein
LPTDGQSSSLIVLIAAMHPQDSGHLFRFLVIFAWRALLLPSVRALLPVAGRGLRLFRGRACHLRLLPHRGYVLPLYRRWRLRDVLLLPPDVLLLLLLLLLLLPL